MRFLKFVVLFAICALPCTANAGLLGSVYSFNGQEDSASTVSPGGVGAIHDVGPAGFSAGDIIYGFVVTNQGVNDYLTGSAAAMNYGGGYGVALFAAQLADGPLPGLFNLNAVTTAGWRLEDLVHSSFQSALAGSDAMVAVLSVGSGSVLTPYLSANNSVAGTGLKYFTNAVYDLELAATASPAGFFQFSSLGGMSGQERGGFNVIAGIGDLGNLQYNKVAISSLFTPPSVNSADIALDTTLVNSSSIQVLGRNWQFESTSSSIRLNGVPEPTTMLAFAGLFGLSVFRRRNR